MPQMAPLMWFLLFLFFFSIFTISMNKHYFNTTTSHKNPHPLHNKSYQKKNWVW